MDRPLGPRAQPAERSTAYEDIFGRRPRAQQLPQSQSRQPQQGYYPQQPYQQQYPGQPQYPPQQQGYYAPPQQQGQGYPGPGPGYGRPPSLRPPTHLSGGAGGVGVPAVPPDGRVDGQGLTPAQAYQAQVAGWRSPSPAPSHMSGGSGRVPVGMGPPPSYTPPPQMHPHPHSHSHPHGQSHLHPQQPQQPPEGTGGERRRDRSSVPPALNVPIGGLDGGRLGLDFDADSPRGWDAAPPAATANGTRAVLEEDEEDERGGREGEEDDEESELPWARCESLNNLIFIFIPWSFLLLVSPACCLFHVVSVLFYIDIDIGAIRLPMHPDADPGSARRTRTRTREASERGGFVCMHAPHGTLDVCRALSLRPSRAILHAQRPTHRLHVPPDALGAGSGRGFGLESESESESEAYTHP
ncbi:hypothetical protein MSAN_00665400 [Mycena sanguinolenta]|uniref:Uncharacterized protein n=1 Tax=Mycena sanguinolenta TaxID=230812 RepID=A0A8H6Z6W3_9AGAR|nr:hypothetical protein MSAN_00665400 [Mycena sanguinolenta]